VSPSQTALTSSPMTSCSNFQLTWSQSTGLSGFGGNAGVSQAATEAKKSSWV